MNTIQKLINKNLIQIDKNNPDFYELERLLHILNSNQHVTIFVAYKQDIDEQFSNTSVLRSSNINFIRIDLNQPYTKKYPHMVSSSKKLNAKKFYFKSDILDFVKNNL